MEAVGVPSAQTKRVIGDLLGRGDALGAIQFCGEVETQDEVESYWESRLMLTRMGRLAITKILDSPGAVWASFHAQEDQSVASRVSRPVSVQVSLFYRFVSQVSQQHLKALFGLREGWLATHGDGWLGRLRGDFGIDGQTRIERVLASAASFYGSGFEPRNNPFEEALKTWRGLARSVERGVDYSDLDLSALDRDPDEVRRCYSVDG